MAFQLGNYGVIPEAIQPYNPGVQFGTDMSNFAPVQAMQGIGGAGAGTGLFGRGWDWMKNNGEMLGGITSGVGSLLSGFNTMRQYGLAKDNFNLQKRAFETNLRNSTQSYNTALEDRVRGRSAEQNEAQIQQYLNQHKLGGR